MNLKMRKAALGLALLASLGAAARAAIRFEAGILGGTRTVNGANVKAVYGNGMVFYPYLAVHVWKGIFVGAGYEGGYSRAGVIGIYKEPTTLRVVGGEAFVGYAFEAWTVSPFVKAGYARYSYKQTIDSPFLGDNAVDANKWSPMIGGGLKIPLAGVVILIGEVRFVPLKVRSFTDEVDLGGMRYTAGLGLKF